MEHNNLYAKSVQMQSYFWSVFSCIRTENRDFLCKSPYSVQIQEIRTKKSSVFGHFSHKVNTLSNSTTQADPDIFKTCLGRLKKVATSCNLTRRCPDVWKKTSDLETSDLHRLYNVQFSTS